MLIRYACYLIDQNSDPWKNAIAIEKSNFAIQIRKQAILEERIAIAERLNSYQKLVETEVLDKFASFP